MRRVGHGNSHAPNFSTHEAKVGGWSFRPVGCIIRACLKTTTTIPAITKKTPLPTYNNKTPQAYTQSC